MAKVKNKEFIKIPTDFRDLHDLKDLVGNYDLVTRLVDTLRGYEQAYVDSYLKTADQVLKYIPVKYHDDYMFRVRHSTYSRTSSWIKYDISEKINVPVDQITDSDCTLKRLLDYVNPKGRMFLVDTKTKIIDVCLWKNPNDKSSDVKYSGAGCYLDKSTKKLVLSAMYSFESYRQEGGVLINRGGPREYRSGGTTVPCLEFGDDEYYFCTQTNRYVGYKPGHRRKY